MDYVQNLHSIGLIYEYLFPCLIHNSGFYLLIQHDFPTHSQTVEEKKWNNNRGSTKMVNVLKKKDPKPMDSPILQKIQVLICSFLAITTIHILPDTSRLNLKSQMSVFIMLN